MEEAIYTQRNHNVNKHHKQWIRRLLVDYYDPMYDYQIARKSDRVVFKGNNDEVLNFLQHQYDIV